MSFNSDTKQTYSKPLRFYESEQVRKKRLSVSGMKGVFETYIKARATLHGEALEELEHMSFYHSTKDPSDLMLDMTKLLSDEFDLIEALNETALILKESTASSDVTVYMVDDSLNEIYQISGGYAGSTHRISYKIEDESTIAASVAKRKTYIHIHDVLKDHRFSQDLVFSDINVKSVLCVPVMISETECIAIFELYRGIGMSSYHKTDIGFVIVMCGWIGSAIKQNQQRLVLQQQQELNDFLLNLTRCYFSDSLLLDKVISDIMNLAKTVLSADHGYFFVMKPSLPNQYKTFADMYAQGIGADKDKMFKKNIQVELLSTDPVGVVIRRGTIVNIKNTFSEYRSGKISIGAAKKNEIVLRSIMCVPIISVEEILGVIKLVNKKGGPFFTKQDETLCEIFALYSGFVLSYARLYEQMINAKNYNSSYKNMLYHQMRPCIHDYEFVAVHQETTLPPRFNNFDFYISDGYELYMPQLIMYMFNETSKQMFDSVNKMINFVLTIQRCYRPNPYHNFMHAFHTAHCMYLMLKRNRELFTITELKGMLIAAYCHDVDHFGITNNFLEVTNHYLAKLYEDSILENHHFHVTMLIIEHLKVFSHLSKDEYTDLISEIEFIILASDLATHFKQRTTLFRIVNENSFDWDNSHHRNLLKSYMMTNADLSSMCKPFVIAKECTDNVYKEFYDEGDREKAMGFSPLSIMDREKKNMMPLDEYNFIAIVVLPCALIVTQLLPNCAVLYTEALRLQDTWLKIHESLEEKKKGTKLLVNETYAFFTSL